MVQKRSKIHHFVPKTLQRPFCSRGDTIWYSEKSSEKFLAPEPRNIDSTFKERNRNTIQMNGGSSDIVETGFYGRLDDFLGKFIETALASLTTGTAPKLEHEETRKVKISIYDIVKRSPDFFPLADDLTIGKYIIEEIAKDLEAEGFLDEAENERKALADKAKITKIGRDFRVRSTVSTSDNFPKISSFLNNLHLSWATSKSRNSFILSSLVCLPANGNTFQPLTNSNNEIWMPISPKNCLILSHNPSEAVPKISELAPDQIRRANEYAARNSRQIASHSKKLLCSLTGYDVRKLPPGP